MGQVLGLSDPRCAVCDGLCKPTQLNEEHGVYFDRIGCWMSYPDVLAERRRTAEAIAYVLELVLDTHERAGTDLKGALEGMVANYRGHRPRAMRVVQDALAQPSHPQPRVPKN